MDDRLGPDERDSACVIGFDEGIDVILELLDAGESRLRLQR